MRERRYIEPLVGVETLADSLDIRKNPLAAAGLAAVGGLATGVGSEATRIAQEKVEQATKDLQASQKTDADRAKRAKTQEGQGAEIEGMNNSQS